MLNANVFEHRSYTFIVHTYIGHDNANRDESYVRHLPSLLQMHDFTRIYEGTVGHTNHDLILKQSQIFWRFKLLVYLI